MTNTWNWTEVTPSDLRNNPRFSSICSGLEDGESGKKGREKREEGRIGEEDEAEKE